MATNDQLELRQTMEHTLSKFLNSSIEVSAAQDARLISSTLDPSCLRYIRPISLLRKLGAPVDFGFDVATFEKAMEGEMPVFRTKSVAISDVSIDTMAKTAAATTVYANRLIDGQEFDLQFSWHVSFTEDGAKVAKIVQWCDAIEFPIYQTAQNVLLEKLKSGKTVDGIEKLNGAETDEKLDSSGIRCSRCSRG